MKFNLNKLLLLIVILLPLNFYAQKAELVVQTGHSDSVRSIAFSPDGKLIASGSNDETIKIWNAETGKQLKTLKIESSVNTVVFSPDGKILASGGDYDGIYLWEIKSGNLLKKLTDDKGIYRDLSFSTDGKTLASAGFEFFTLWNIETGKADRKIQAQTKEYVSSVAYSPDGKMIAASGWNKTANLWNAETGENIKTFEGAEFAAISITFSPDGKHLFLASHKKPIAVLNIESGELKNQTNTDKSFSVAVSPDGKMFASGVENNSVKIWNAANEQQLKTFSGQTEQINSVEFSPDGKILASASSDKTIRLWNIETGEEIKNLNSLSGVIAAIAFSPVETVFASSDSNRKINLWNLETGKKIQTFDNKDKIVQTLKFSHDGKLLASIGWNSGTVKVWDMRTGKLLRSFTEQNVELGSVDFSPDGKLLATDSYSSSGGLLSVWNIETGKKLRTFEAEWVNLGVTFAKDGKRILSGSEHGTVAVRTIASGEKLFIKPYEKPQDEKLLLSIAPNFGRGNPDEPLSPNGKFRLKRVELNGEINLYQTKPEKHLANLISVGENDWAVVTPEGLFDVSPGARKQMHYAVGFETVSLEQLKDVYYVPGLLKKIYDGEPLPRVELFSAKELFPLAEYKLPQNGEKEFSVKITNRGGGIGQIQVLINGKEFLKDARSVGFDPNQKSAVLQIDLKDAPLIEGKENKIEIITRNAEGSISSRGTPRGREIINSENTSSNLPPNVYIIAGGISNYTGDDLDLKFAAKDAASFAKALEIGASNLFGADKVHLRLLTSDPANTSITFQSKDAKILSATKADFVGAFNDFKTATPNDIFIVYLAGHGISISNNQSANSDLYLYLTQEATTNDKTVLAVENSRKAMTISSDELTELIKQNKALKQVLILDTCAAGAAANSLIAQRDLPSDQIRAIERLKDRTGFFVLMGAAANKVSYEATQYGQGLLTYSLLQGLKGAKLRENQFADVNLLFSYAQDTVPEMAKYIGGIQKPLIISPDTSESFDIGRFTADEQKEIKLATLKPIILNPSLQNRDTFYDDQDLTPLVRQQLRNLSFTVDAETFEIPIVFVEADEMVDAIKPSGSYTINGQNINLTIRLIKNKKPIKTLSIIGKLSEKEKFVQEIVNSIKNNL